MGISLYEMFEDDTPVALQVGRGVVNFRFNSATLSPAMMANLSGVEAIGTEGESLQAYGEVMLKIAGMVAGVVTWWDVIGRDNQPVPITTEAVSHLPVRFLKLVMEKIIEVQEGESVPGERTSEGSASISSRQAVPNGSATSPNGTRGSSPATVSAFPRGSFSQGNHANRNGQGRPWSPGQPSRTPRPGPR